ncbi:flagellar hook protein FlgE [Zoogloea sp. LCSB751]|uniref:flagellar hook protein FlgE n=1 Tax=Zoogloea sp. LCSB751 TaxID=1965277 RepID=UPI0009A48EFC|nr:flagellar hook-basal body complex protein [Zoogloea sp. LCSB751]
MSFEIALSGINAVNTQLDTISNNIANSGTYGFKSSRANFASEYAGSQSTGTTVSSQTQSINVGGGVLSTGRGMDAAILGRGFFVSKDVSGQSVYSRVGVFSVNKDGYVVDGSGRRVQGYAAIAGSATLGAMGDLQVPAGQVAAKATDKLQYVANMSADWSTPAVAPFDPTDPQSFNGSMVSVVYDSLGTQHSVTQYFVKLATNQVVVHYGFDGTVQPTTTTLQFDPAGQLTSPAAAVALPLGTPTGAAPLTVNIDYAGTTQFAGEATTTANAANGYASGTLTSVQIADDGGIMVQYSNGQKQRTGTLALATFPDEGALTPAGGTSWAMSNDSGTPLFFTPGSGMAGKLTSGALEQSNVELTGELVNLMTAQRNYQANTKVISAQSQMMQNLMQAI